ncbi:10592_t:CDS:1, partial [Acaulospora colombiana]
RQSLLKGNYGITDEILGAVPPLVPSPDDEIDKSFYWMPHIVSAKIKHASLANKKEVKMWVEAMKSENFIELQQATQYHELVKRAWNEQIQERELKLKDIIREFCQDVETFCRTPLSLNFMKSVRVNPFIEPEWENYRKKLIEIVGQEVQKNPSIDNAPNSKSVKKSLYDFMRENICKKLRNHTYYTQPNDSKSKPSLSIEDDFFKYILQCPSYKVPPIDPRFPNPVRRYSYSEEFWKTRLFPTLLNEAERLHSSGVNSSICIFDPAVLGGMVNNQCPLFGCQLCDKDFQFSGFEKTKKHMSKEHKILTESEKIREMKVDKAKIIDHLPTIFSLRN